MKPSTATMRITTNVSYNGSFATHRESGCRCRVKGRRRVSLKSGVKRSGPTRGPKREFASAARERCNTRIYRLFERGCLTKGLTVRGLFEEPSTPFSVLTRLADSAENIFDRGCFVATIIPCEPCRL